MDDFGDGWNFTHAYDINDGGINDGGQIVGFGSNPNGVHHALLLTPIPEPGTLARLGMAVADLLACGWRRRNPAGQVLCPFAETWKHTIKNKGLLAPNYR